MAYSQQVQWWWETIYASLLPPLQSIPFSCMIPEPAESISQGVGTKGWCHPLPPTLRSRDTIQAQALHPLFISAWESKNPDTYNMIDFMYRSKKQRWDISLVLSCCLILLSTVCCQNSYHLSRWIHSLI